MAEKRSKEPAVIIGENRLYINYVNPDKMDNYVWDDDMYENGNLFLKGKANAIKVDKESTQKNSVELIASKRYKQFMQSNAIAQAFNPDNMDTRRKYLLLGLGILNILILGIQVVTLSQF